MRASRLADAPGIVEREEPAVAEDVGEVRKPGCRDRRDHLLGDAAHVLRGTHSLRDGVRAEEGADDPHWQRRRYTVEDPQVTGLLGE
jgi:hypothetical protein